MTRRVISRLVILCCAGAAMLTLAIAPRPARPAVPAKPAQSAGDGLLSGRVILVDAGHGGTDGGAVARDSGIAEKVINLQVALLVRELLEADGATALMTRETDMQYSENKRADLTARLDIAKNGNAEILVSIHMNEYRTRRESGPQVFYRAGQEKSRLLAGCLQSALIQELKPKKERKAMAGDYFMLSLSIPSVLVECGFLSNAAEEKLLLTEDYQKQVAQAIRDGIVEFFLLETGEKTFTNGGQVW